MLELNLPVYFSTALLFIAGFILLLISFSKVKLGHRDVISWSGLSVVFIVLAFDELLGLHEDLGWIANNLFGRDNLLIQDWAYAGIVIVLVAAIIYWPFFKNLPRFYKRGFFISAFLYVGGFLGVEIIGSIYVIRQGIQATPYLIFTTIEETLEMVGIIIFIYFLQLYLEELRAGKISVKSDAPDH